MAPEGQCRPTTACSQVTKRQRIRKRIDGCASIGLRISCEQWRGFSREGVGRRMVEMGTPDGVRVDVIAADEEDMYVNARAIMKRNTLSGTEMVLQTRHKPHEGENSIEFPAEGRDNRDTHRCLETEVREETGLTLTHIEGLSTGHCPDRRYGCGMRAALCRLPNDQGTGYSMGIYFAARLREAC